MFIAVILGYVLVSVFALCGVFNCVNYCFSGAPGDAGTFLNGLTTAALPLLYAAVLLLLIQIATQLERLGIQNELSLLRNATPSTPAKAPRKRDHGTVYIPKSKSSEAHTDRQQQYFVTRETPAPPSTPDIAPAPEPTDNRETERHFFKTN